MRRTTGMCGFWHVGGRRAPRRTARGRYPSALLNGEAPAIMAPGSERMSVIDCDLHNVVPSTEALFPYLSQLWRETVTQTLFKGAPDPIYPRNAPTTARPGTVPPD